MNFMQLSAKFNIILGYGVILKVNGPFGTLSANGVDKV